MTGWTETTLRNAASWQAFKEGKALFDQGAVAMVKSGASGWQGSVKAGSRTFKVSVKVNSPTDLETRCSCPANQSTGQVCAHAVATGLAALRPAADPKPVLSPGPRKPVVAPDVPSAWEVAFPGNWSDALLRGKIAATLLRLPAQEITVADERLTAWLTSVGQPVKDSVSIHLDEKRADSFLESIADHPRLFVGKDKQTLEVQANGRLRLAAIPRMGDRVQLVPDTLQPVFALGESWWRITEAGLGKIGKGNLPDDLSRAWGALLQNRSAEIPVERFLDRMEIWQEWLEFPSEEWLDRLHFIPAAGEIDLALDGILQQLEATLRIKYEGSPLAALAQGNVVSLPRLEGDRCLVRNTALENQAAGRLLDLSFQSVDLTQGKWLLRGEAEVTHFLNHALPGLRKNWKVHEGQKFSATLKQVAFVSPQIEIHDSGEDWLSFNLSFKTNEGSIIGAAEIRQLLRAGSGGRTSKGRKVVLSDEIAELIDPLFEEMDLRQENGHFIAKARDAELIQELRKKLDKSSESNELEKLTFEVPETVRATLRPYQKQGVAWLIDRLKHYGGALLADDMGLGKTLQTITCIDSLNQISDQPKPVLVIATASLLGNWKAEFEKFAPGQTVRIFHGASRESERGKVQPGDILLTSFGTLSRDLAWHLKQSYHAVVVDEASLMRNPDTDHAKAVCKLRADHRIALTGTPVENGVRDLWSIFRFIQPGWLGSREEFRDRYEQPLGSGAGAAALLDRLRLKTSPFMLRRTKEQVAPELPSKIFIDEYCDLSSEQQGVYRELLAEGRKRVEVIQDSKQTGAARMQMLTTLLRLRQTCCDLALLKNDRFKQLSVTKRSAKLERLLELIEEAVSGNHKMLIFSQFQTQLREIEECIVARGWRSLRLDGQTRNRQALVDQFQTTDGPPIFLISLKAGGYGLNLTQADTVVHFDPWWNPAAEAQATDRAHRIGQTRPVTVYRLLTRGTVEEKVVRLQAKKKEVASMIDETGSGDAAGWSVEEMMKVITE
jgi:superfamily II DNA or RNA helicase